MASTPSTRWVAPGHCQPAQQPIWQTCRLRFGWDSTTLRRAPQSRFLSGWFVNGTTLYVCDEGDGTLVSPALNGNVADAQTMATAGHQKWSLVNGTWKIDYVLQDGLNIGVPYSVVNYPAALNPATHG